MTTSTSTSPTATASHTIRLHRVLAAPADRIYRAFTTPAAWAKWLPPHGFTGTVHQLDAVVGGSYRMSFTSLASDHGHAFGGRYLELVPGLRLCYTSAFDDPNMTGEMQTTVTLAAVPSGTEMHVVQEGVPAAIPADDCYRGWQQSLALLALLVETDVQQ